MLTALIKLALLLTMQNFVYCNYLFPLVFIIHHVRDVGVAGSNPVTQPLILGSIHRLSTEFHFPSGRSAPMTGSANDATRSSTVENSAGTLDSINLMIRFRYLLVRITQGLTLLSVSIAQAWGVFKRKRCAYVVGIC